MAQITRFKPGEFDALVRQIAAGGTVDIFFWLSLNMV